MKKHMTEEEIFEKKKRKHIIEIVVSTILVVLAVVALLIGVSHISKREAIRSFNEGHCQHCYGELYYDGMTEYQGDVLYCYRCSKCDSYILLECTANELGYRMEASK